MKKTRLSEQQMVKILRVANATPVVEVARRHGISSQTIHLWRKRFGKFGAADVKRLRHLQQENTTRRKLVANWSKFGSAEAQLSHWHAVPYGFRISVPD